MIRQSRSFHRGVGSCLLSATLLTTGQLITNADEATLTCAKDLAREYKNYTYGSGSNKIDCVHFVLNVVECRLKQSLPPDARKAILIAYGWSDSETEEKAKAGTDPKLAGVQYALTQILAKGKKIEPSQAKAGDLVQYWMPRANGKWFGHSAVITKVEGNLATLLGAHESANAVTELSRPLNLQGTNRHIFVVRIEE